MYKETFPDHNIQLQPNKSHIHFVMSLLCSKVHTTKSFSTGTITIIFIITSTMLLRTSIPNTKKFFQKTLHNFKSFFIPRYQKLPKNPPHNSMAIVSAMDKYSNPCYKDLEKFYSDFTEQWDSEKYKKARRRSKKKAVLSCTTKQENEVCNESLISMKLDNARNEKKEGEMEKREECDNDNNKRSLTHKRLRQEDSSFNSMVEKKLRELEKLDKSNVDYLLDIEEVLHYYSRLTCPTYLEIVDKFFMEMYSEFFGPARSITITPPSVNSKLKLRPVRS